MEKTKKTFKERWNDYLRQLGLLFLILAIPAVLFNVGPLAPKHREPIPPPQYSVQDLQDDNIQIVAPLKEHLND